MANGSHPGLFRNVRWCCKCHKAKEPRGGKIVRTPKGERFTCKDCCG